MAEALNGTFKAELVTLHGPWRTRRQLEIAIVEWIDWYNHRRLHGEIGDIPPDEHETLWYRQQDPALRGRKPINQHRIKPGLLHFDVSVGAHVCVELDGCVVGVGRDGRPR